MSKLEINASKSSVQVSAEGIVALIIGSAVALSVVAGVAFSLLR